MYIALRPQYFCLPIAETKGIVHHSETLFDLFIHNFKIFSYLLPLINQVLAQIFQTLQCPRTSTSL